MRDREPREPTTVLDHLRPTVVRRRVVVDVAALNRPKLESPETKETDTPTEPEPEVTRSSGCYPRASVAPDDDSSPPSSILAPDPNDALEQEEEPDDDTDESADESAPLAGEEAEPIVSSRDEREAAPPSVAPKPMADARPTIPLGPTVAVGTIAKRLGLPSAQVAAELVSRGFFEVTPATVLTRDTARIVADAFGCAVEEVPEPEPVKAKAPRKRTARRAAPSKRSSKTAPKPKKRTGRSTRRAA